MVDFGRAVFDGVLVLFSEASEMAKTCKASLAKGASKYALIRHAKGRAGQQLLTILDTIVVSPKK